MSLTENQANDIVKSVLNGAFDKFLKELEGDNEEYLDRVLRGFRSKIARHSWKASQQWCKWDDEGPVLMPDHSRIYYRKGNTEVMLLEYSPQIRLMKFKGSLASRSGHRSPIGASTASSVSTFSLALPYVVFIVKFVDGMYSNIRCAFSDRPLKRLEEQPLRPYLSNLNEDLAVCLGRDFDKSKLEKGNLSQQVAYVLDHFWGTIYSDEYSEHFWDSREHFQNTKNPHMTSLQSWEEASQENPLFVVEDVDWLPHEDKTFGDMVVGAFVGDSNNKDLNDDLYDQLIDNFLDELKKTYEERIKLVGEKITQEHKDSLTKELLTNFQN